MARMNQGDALREAIKDTAVPPLSKSARDTYAIIVVTKALQLLGVRERVAKSLAHSMNGSPRVRLDKALRRVDQAILDITI